MAALTTVLDVGLFGFLRVSYMRELKQSPPTPGKYSYFLEYFYNTQYSLLILILEFVVAVMSIESQIGLYQTYYHWNFVNRSVLSSNCLVVD